MDALRHDRLKEPGRLTLRVSIPGNSATAGIGLHWLFTELRNPPVFVVTSPILLLWLLAPALVWRLSKPGTEDRPDLTEQELMFLNKTARKTWAFFEQFVTIDDNWLPPDNFQEPEGGVIAHRTSPTNMGMTLLANLAAYDFGYLSGSRLLDRCGQTVPVDGYPGAFQRAFL